MTDIGRTRVPARSVIASVAAAAMVLVAVQLSSPQSASAAELCSAGAVLNVVAHEDDDLLFQSTTLVNDIDSGRCVRTVFVSAGEADDTDPAYWQGREAGSRAAYAQMAGVANDWTTSDAGVVGYSITMETLVAAPQISLVFMRLPDSAVDGWGGANYNSESLQGLFENTVTTIHSIAAPVQSYTIDQLRNTLTELMTDFQPTSINTQDFVGHYGDGDHSDHHTVAYLALQAQAKYAAPHTFTGYRGYVIESQPANLTAAQIAQKQANFFTYAAFDPKTCHTVPDCAYRAEASWLQRQYEATPPAFVPGSNIAGSAVVQASSQDPLQPALAAVDGVVGGYPDKAANEWSTIAGGAGSWLSLSWASPAVLDQVVLFDRPNAADQVTGGTLTFSDGSTVVVPALTNDGSAVAVSFPARATSSVLFTVTSVSGSTANVGLAEIQTRVHEPVDLDSGTPVLTGSVKVGQSVGVSPGAWGPGTVSFSYQWMRDGEPIVGATSSTYVPVNVDAGSMLGVAVTGSADYYLPVSASSATTMVTGGVLSSSVPQVSGSAVVGGTVSASAGTWGPGSVSFSYQWMRAGVAISGATGSSFTPTTAEFGKSITVAVTGTRTGFDAVTKVSAGVTVGPGALVSSTPVLTGSVKVGQSVGVSPGAWGPGAVAFSYQWMRDGEPIVGATSSTYVPVNVDAGSMLGVAVTGSADYYLPVSASSATTMVTGGVLTSSVPQVSGSAVVGGTVSASAGAWAPGSVSFSYQWMRAGVAISGATGSSFTPTTAEFGKSITVAVTGTRTGFDAVTKVSAGVTVGPGALVSSVPTVSGTMVSGQVLTASSPAWGPGTVNLSYQWKRNGAAISGATGNMYTLVRADVSAVVTVTVTGSKVGYVAKSLSSVSAGSVSASLSRSAGADRYAASAAVSAASFAPGVPVVYIASGQVFPDALSAAPVAGREGGPVLLVTSSRIPESIRTELVRLKPGRIVVVGGTASISDAVLSQLHQFTTIKPNRLDGADRYAASAAVSAASFAPGVPVVYIASGQVFPDALSAAPVAGREGGPVLLVTSSRIPESIRTELVRLKPGRIVVVGGTASISDAVYQELLGYVGG